MRKLVDVDGVPISHLYQRRDRADASPIKCVPTMSNILTANREQKQSVSSTKCVSAVSSLLQNYARHKIKKIYVIFPTTASVSRTPRAKAW